MGKVSNLIINSARVASIPQFTPEYQVADSTVQGGMRTVNQSIFFAVITNQRGRKLQDGSRKQEEFPFPVTGWNGLAEELAKGATVGKELYLELSLRPYRHYLRDGNGNQLFDGQGNARYETRFSYNIENFEYGDDSAKRLNQEIANYLELEAGIAQHDIFSVRPPAWNGEMPAWLMKQYVNKYGNEQGMQIVMQRLGTDPDLWKQISTNRRATQLNPSAETFGHAKIKPKGSMNAYASNDQNTASAVANAVSGQPAAKSEVNPNVQNLLNGGGAPGNTAPNTPPQPDISKVFQPGQTQPAGNSAGNAGEFNVNRAI